MNKLSFLKAQSRIVLASESKPRSAVLAQVGLPFETMSSGFPEDLPKTQYSAEQYALMNAKIKADLVHRKLQGSDDKFLIVIGCDTVIENGQGEIIEKPLDATDAKKILRSFSGKTHRVCTGVQLVVSSNSGTWERNFVQVTQVRFAVLSDDMIDSYVASGEPMNKAGAYAIQGLGALLIDSIDGDYNSVVGLPLFRVFETLGGLLDELIGQSTSLVIHKELYIKNMC